MSAIVRPFALLAVLALSGALLVLTASPAQAACHVAGFVEGEVEGQESAGVVSVVVELQGQQPSCAGTVDVTTVDGTALAGSDYEAVSTTLTFEANDDRVETVELVLLADDEAEPVETFTVELSNPTGDISSTGGPAVVNIVDDDGGATDGEATEDEVAEDEVADDTATQEDDADQPDVEEEGGNEDGSSTTLLIVLGVLAVIAIGGFLAMRANRE